MQACSELSTCSAQMNAFTKALGRAPVEGHNKNKPCSPRTVVKIGCSRKRQHLTSRFSGPITQGNMTQYYTDQDRIDAQTMRIENPNIVGSGYIQFPPQRPFEKPVQIQPPTVAHLEYPQEYQQYTGAAQPASRPASQPTPSSSAHTPQANGNARGPGTPSLPQAVPSNPAQPRQAVPQAQAQAPAGRQGYATNPRPPAAYHTAVGGQAGAGRVPQQRPAQAAPSQRQPTPPVPHYTPNHAAQQRQNPTANASHAPLPQSMPPQARVPAAALRPTAALTSPAAVAASSKGDDDDDKSGMSKAQKKRLRKKMREGGI